MSARDDGGQAFPCEFFETEHGDEVRAFACSPGMSLRDWFAGQALGAMSADLQRNQEYGATMRELASKAYVIADAMLRERFK